MEHQLPLEMPETHKQGKLRKDILIHFYSLWCGKNLILNISIFKGFVVMFIEISFRSKLFGYVTSYWICVLFIQKTIALKFVSENAFPLSNFHKVGIHLNNSYTPTMYLQAISKELSYHRSLS